MTGNDSEDAGPPERVLEIIREFDAPRTRVWTAWTDPADAVRWMGPHGFTATHVSGELRPGGAWRLCIRRDADGTELWQGGVYREVVAPRRLVFTFAWDDADGRAGPETLVKLDLAELDGGRRTRMTFRQAVFNTEANRDGHRGGWSEAFERLAAHVTTEGEQDR